MLERRIEVGIAWLTLSRPEKLDALARELVRLNHRYGRRIDNGRLEELAAPFTHGTWRDSRTGADEVLTWIPGDPRGAHRQRSVRFAAITYAASSRSRRPWVKASNAIGASPVVHVST